MSMAPHDTQWLARRPDDRQAIVLHHAMSFLLPPSPSSLDREPGADATSAAVRVCSRACYRRQATVQELCRQLFFEAPDDEVLKDGDMAWLGHLYEHGYAVVDDYFPPGTILARM
jgi:hypothetical protein